MEGIPDEDKRVDKQCWQPKCAHECANKSQNRSLHMEETLSSLKSLLAFLSEAIQYSRLDAC